MKKYLLLLALLLWAGLAGATDRFVSTGGSGSTCSIGSPCSITTAIPLTVAGDTIQMRSGTYAVFLDSNSITFNSGTTFANAPQIVSYDGIGAAIIQPSGDTGALNLADLSGLHHYIFDGLTFDCVNVSGGTGHGCVAVGSTSAVHHIRFTNVEVKNTGTGGSLSADIGPGILNGGSSNEFVNCNLHHNGFGSSGVGGSNAPYGIYNTGASTVIDNCQIHHNGGFGIHSYKDSGTGVDNVTVKNNKVYENGQVSSQQVAGILISSGSGNTAFNNEVWTTYTGTQITGISVGTDFKSCVNCSAYYNTVYGFQLYGLQIPIPSTGTIARNNILHNNATNLFNQGTASTLSNNLCTSACGAGTSNQAEAASATFVDGSTQNFTLRSTSLAKDNAIAVSGITTDAYGTTRTGNGSGPDIGARELAAPVSCPANPHSLVASYDFDGVATDGSGDGFTATLASGAGYSGNRLLVADAGGATVADADLLDLCDGFTLTARINLPSVASDAMFVVKNPNSKYFIGMLAGYCSGSPTLIGGYSQTVLVAPCESTPLSTSTDIFVAVTYDGMTVKLYKGMTMVASTAGSATLDATTGTLQICTSGFSEHCPNGTTIDNVKVYTYARSPVELVSDMGTVSRTVKVGIGNTLKIGLQ